MKSPRAKTSARRPIRFGSRVEVRRFRLKRLFDEVTRVEGAGIEVDIPGGGAPLMPEQAVVLIRFLDETNGDIERLHRVLTNIANSATFTESRSAAPTAFRRVREFE